jgi:hypothetical protein
VKIINNPCYRCEFCRKLYERKHFAEAHEINCKKNPANERPCFFCNQAEMKEEEYFFDTHYGEDSRMVKALYCKAKKHFIYPPSVARSDHGPYEFGDVGNEPMPQTCEIFDDFLIKEKKDGYGIEHIPVHCIGKLCKGEL